MILWKLSTVRFWERETLVMDIASVLIGLLPSAGFAIYNEVQVCAKFS